MELGSGGAGVRWRPLSLSRCRSRYSYRSTQESGGATHSGGATRTQACTVHVAWAWAWVWAWAWAWAMGMRRALVRGSTAALTSVTCAAPSSVSALSKARLTRVSSGAAWDLLAWGLSPLGSARLGFEPSMAYGSWKSPRPSPSPGFET